MPPEDGFGWSGRHPVHRRRRRTDAGAGAVREPRTHIRRFPGVEQPEGEMFEPLADTEKKSTGRSMKVIWIVIVVAAVILAVISFT